MAALEHYVTQARTTLDMGSVRLLGINETGVRRGQQYITVVHDLDVKRLLFATPGRDHHTVGRFAQDLQVHGGQRANIVHACMDMSVAYALGVGRSLPLAQISYDRYDVVALANQAMGEVRSAEWKQEAPQVHVAQPLRLECQTEHDNALAAARQPQERTGLAAQDGAAPGVRSSAPAQRCPHGRSRSEMLDQVGHGAADLNPSSAWPLRWQRISMR